jgi:protein involved in polysaccharide export with SLBB domain
VFADTASGTVTIGGEVKYPGTYNILRGERLSSLLARVGGLTQEAYPYGTVFMRRSVAALEQKAFKREAQDIRSQMFDALIRPQRATSTQTPPSPEAFEALSGMLSQIEAQPALGRVAYTADPPYLAKHPNRDPLLEAGDSIVVPKKPSSVSVLGEVMQPGAVPYDPSLTPSDYIKLAGGPSQFADESGMIVVLPDGTAKTPGDGSWLSFGDERVPPGSVVMVPRDLTSLRLSDLLVDSTQIFAQFATLTAALSLLAQGK